MLANAGVNINDSVQVRNYLNGYYNRNYSYAAYSQVLSGCANQTLNYVLALPGIEAEEAKEGYRFGFNAGSEKDDEIFIGAYTAEYWEYDSRLGRRWNVDPLTYAWQSSYVVLNNSPILFIDPSGLEAEGSGSPQGKNDDDSKIYNSKEKLNVAVITAKRPGKLKTMWANFKYSITSKQYREYRRNQKKESQAEELKHRGEYKSYGWSHEQNQAASRFMLNVTLSTMTGGMGFVGGRIGNVGVDAAAQLVANGFNYEKLNTTSIILSGFLPGTFTGHAAKNILASGATINLDGTTQIIGLTTDYTFSRFVFNSTVGFAFDRIGAHYEGLADVSTSYLTRMLSLSYKPKVAANLVKYRTAVLMTTAQSKIGLSATSNTIQNLK